MAASVVFGCVPAFAHTAEGLTWRFPWRFFASNPRSRSSCCDGGGRALGRVSRRARDLAPSGGVPAGDGRGWRDRNSRHSDSRVEVAIAASAIVLGLMVALAARPPLWIAAVLVGAFAIFHGHAHGAELPPGADAVAYSAGFVIATGLLHVTGITFGNACALARRSYRRARGRRGDCTYRRGLPEPAGMTTAAQLIDAFARGLVSPVVTPAHLIGLIGLTLLMPRQAQRVCVVACVCLAIGDGRRACCNCLRGRRHPGTQRGAQRCGGVRHSRRGRDSICLVLWSLPWLLSPVLPSGSIHRRRRFR